MISNLSSQLATMKMEQRLPEILEEAAQVRRDLGYPILVSPFAQYIVTQAVAERRPGRALQDDSRRGAQVRVGFYGRLAAQPSAEFLERAKIKPGEMCDRAAGGAHRAVDARLRKELGPSRRRGPAARRVLRSRCSSRSEAARRRYEFATSPLTN